MHDSKFIANVTDRLLIVFFFVYSERQTNKYYIILITVKYIYTHMYMYFINIFIIYNLEEI